MSVKDIIEKRRAYRSIEPVEITESIIDDLANCASLAPSCFNNQPWRFVFVYGEKALEEFRAVLSEGNEWAHYASLYVVPFTKPELDCRIKGRDYDLFDTGMAFAFMMLRATELGLVFHPIAGFDAEKTKKLLSIPDDMTVLTVAIIGKKMKELRPALNDKQKAAEQSRPERLKQDKFIFRNKFND